MPFLEMIEGGTIMFNAVKSDTFHLKYKDHFSVDPDTTLDFSRVKLFTKMENIDVGDKNLVVP